MLTDIRHALRVLARSPGFAAVAVLSLALGIGANSAIFSLADAILLRPLAVRDASAVVTVTSVTPEDQTASVSYPDYRDFREKNRSFEGLVAFEMTSAAFSPKPGMQPQMRVGLLVSDNFFNVLGVEPALGRALAAGEGVTPGKDAVLVLGHDFWRDQLGRDPSILGRTVRLSGIDFTVIGVMPEAFTGVDQYVRQAFYAPLSMKQRLAGAKENPLVKRSARSLNLKGRLKDGVNIEMAQAELIGITKNLEKEYPDTNRNRTAAVRTELDSRIKQSPPDAILVTTLMALVGVVLIIACANVANLLLARARGRSREIAIRLAIGAGRWQLVRQLMIESGLLSLAGGLTGLVVAYAGISFIQTLTIPSDLPIIIAAKLDQRVLLFSFFAAVASAVVFGLVPALQASKPSLVQSLRASGAGGGGRGRTIGRNVLVAGEVALAMVLLVASAMILQGFRNLLIMNPGFRTDHRAMLEFNPALIHYTEQQTRDFYRTLKDRSALLPGVKSLTLSKVIPFFPNQAGEAVAPEGYQFTKGRESASVLSNIVDEKYFDTMQTSIVKGRAFTADDQAGSRPVAIVNEEFVKTYFANQDPIGRRIKLTGRGEKQVEVVGVAKTGKYMFVGEPPMSFLYLPFAQNERTDMFLVIEAEGDVASLIPQIRELVRSYDADLPVYNVRTFDSYYQQRAMAPPRMILQMVSIMGLVGLVIALVGLYGLVAYAVSRRTQEIGIRMAIGADRASVLRMVLKQGLALGVAGIAVGGALMLAVGGAMMKGLLGLAQPSAVTYVAVPLALVVVTALASYIPARRASRIDPLVALRYE
jgi:predicted permease